jgi:hypothetical protein
LLDQALTQEFPSVDLRQEARLRPLAMDFVVNARMKVCELLVLAVEPGGVVGGAANGELQAFTFPLESAASAGGPPA